MSDVIEEAKQRYRADKKRERDTRIAISEQAICEVLTQFEPRIMDMITMSHVENDGADYWCITIPRHHDINAYHYLDKGARWVEFSQYGGGWCTTRDFGSALLQAEKPEVHYGPVTSFLLHFLPWNW